MIYVKLDLPTEMALVPLVRHQVAAFLEHLNVRHEDVYRVETVVTEACSNVIRHAYGEPGHRYVVEFEYHPERLMVTVTDAGKGFDVCMVREPALGQIGGYGIYFIRESADSVIFEDADGRGTKVTAEIALRYNSDEALHFARSLEPTSYQ